MLGIGDLACDLVGLAHVAAERPLNPAGRFEDQPRVIREGVEKRGIGLSNYPLSTTLRSCVTGSPLAAQLLA